MTAEPSSVRTNPFIVHRNRLDTHRAALAAGFSDDWFVALVSELDDRIATIAGTGFFVTPLVELETPLERSVLAKIETGNVSGSHKARHLFGLLLQSEIERRSRPAPPDTDRPLAIASCGNAALGAAVVAKAAKRQLDVFVPAEADPLVVERLRELDANVVVCERADGEMGDPCMVGLVQDIEAGAEPFTVQGTTCPGVFDGARTIGYELAEQVAERRPTDLYLQIGGGAFASAVMDGLLGADVRPIPRLHPVQPVRAHPYAAAWDRLVPRLLTELGDLDPGDQRQLAELLVEPSRSGRFDRIIAAADDVMVPWPATPTSVATGILDDVTYDWRPLVSHQLRSGGWPILASEEDLEQAAALAGAQVKPPPDATGAAGLAGALIDRVTEADGPALVVLSGIDRSWEAEQALSSR